MPVCKNKISQVNCKDIHIVILEDGGGIIYRHIFISKIFPPLFITYL